MVKQGKPDDAINVGRFAVITGLLIAPVVRIDGARFFTQQSMENMKNQYICGSL